MNVLIMADFGFPYGTGAASRTYSYASGLRVNGARVKVLCVEPSKASEDALNLLARGTYRGVEYEYTYGRTSRPAERVERGFRKVEKWWRFLSAVRAWQREVGKVDAVIVYSRSLAWLAAAKVACRAVGALFVHEDCELPFVWLPNNTRTKVRRWLYEHIGFRWFDGCLAISTCLQDYCRQHLRPSADVLIVPILVDVSEFDADADGKSTEGDAIVYCGTATHGEVFGLVEAFGAVARENPELRLQVIGPPFRPHLLPELWDRARRVGAAAQLELLGGVKREELPRLLSAARVLVLPRSDAAFSRAGLPTKLGDYLATGRPVVVSAVGDIPRYLQDGVNAYLVEPGDLQAFEERLLYVLGHPDESMAVGHRGRETARARFDPVVHGARVLAFIDKLQSSHSSHSRRKRRTAARGSRAR